MASTGKSDQRREARERLRNERAAEVRRARLRGRLLVGAGLSTVLVIAAAAGILAAKPGGSDDGEAAGRPFVQPAHTEGEDGIVVPYGRAGAPHTLTVWLDPRCPFCAGVEQGLGPTFKEQADAGEYRIEYRFATFLDQAFGGRGSRRALNALGAAVNESPEKFMAYAQVLFAHHPARETDDVYASTDTLLDLAGRVPGLRTPAFDRAVTDLTYMPWVEKVGQAFRDEGMKGTPAVFIDGTKLTVNSGDGIASVTPQAFRQLVAEHRRP
ncbi:DsbA family protein [Streptomyces sp. cmx-4-9]|uniref:DsbA family protein n=1 Tax=Streptomyces sp. cmx-4-9 TaxID=2790941 RepID=UPI003980FB94